ncbi:hypothetical protein [Borborobacter arsenicus]|nr:hypothetical protein [Pseudaminobacter arsenicus]
MSCYAIIVTIAGPQDATIDFDPPLRPNSYKTFPDESGDDLALWLYG